MVVYIALLRGINVGGKNIIKMAELKKMFEAMGYDDVQTYIQSGNVLFSSSEDEETLREKLERRIEDTFGIASSVVLRTSDQLFSLIENCPFSEEEIAKSESTNEGESLYVALLSGSPSQQALDRLISYRNESEELRMMGRDLYLLFSQSIRNSKLANNLQKLDVAVTTRNWKTINKLAEMAKR